MEDDVIVSVDGVSVGHMSSHEAESRLKGPAGTGVVVGIWRGGLFTSTDVCLLPWQTLVVEGVPDAGDPRIFRCKGRELKVPEEDEYGVTTITDARTGEIVYRGSGRYEGVWGMLCHEGRPYDPAEGDGPKWMVRPGLEPRTTSHNTQPYTLSPKP